MKKNLKFLSQYFERSFEMLQKQIAGLAEGQKRIQDEMDKRFEQVDKRFEQIDHRFEQLVVSINRLSDKRLISVIRNIDRLPCVCSVSLF